MMKYIFGGFIFNSLINFSVLQLFLLEPLPLPPPDSREQIDTGFYLHTNDEPNRAYRVSAYNLTSLINSPFNASKDTKFIVHGYYHNGNRSWLKNMTAALLSHGDYNVIRVDWGNGSLTLPDKAMANTEVVGEEIAYFVNTLKEKLNLNASKCHCIGHSMGGYVCGFAGQRIDKLGRISGLDPGFVRFFHVDNNKTLDPSDATFVDVYHTGFSLLNIAPSLAFIRPLGHIDIYLNNGEQQPGCQISVQSLLDTNNNIEDYFLDYFINEAVCGHFRIITYYIESILNSSCQWVAYECPSYERFKRGECATCGDDNSKCAFLGLRASEYADKTRENVMLYIETAPEPPFCVQHYVVNISTGIIAQGGLRSGGEITFEVIGDTGSFTNDFQIDSTDHEDTVKRLFTNHVKVGQITSVKLTWESYLSYLLGLILNSYTLGVNSIKISPLTFYPESVRKMQEAVACLPSEGPPTPVNDEETKSFPVMANC